VRKLASRERQIAAIIYERGCMTAKELEQLLEPRLSNGAIRSMLLRLVHKGILRRHSGKVGRGQSFVYVPAITPQETKERALTRLSQDYFDGSLLKMAVEIFDVIETRGVHGPEGDFDDRPNAPDARLAAW
jgi:predicted transcriptional regulator